MSSSESNPDQAWQANVRPANWVNPSPNGRYGLVVIGAGSAGLVSAAGAAGLGARVALIEKHRLGGDCLNTGCVPSKALLASARGLRELKNWQRLGLVGGNPPHPDFASMMQRMRQIRAEISPHDSASRFQGLGVDVFFGSARFTGPQAIEVDGTRLTFSKAIIATGARPAIPEIPGLRAAGPLTSESIFTLTSLPRRLAVIGGGPLGCDLGQAFARFGSVVTLIESNPQILHREDPDAAAMVAASLERDGLQILRQTSIVAVECQGTEKRLQLQTASGPQSLPFDAILVAVGRSPNFEGLELERAGVALNSKGLVLDDRLRTTNRRIYAAGDVATKYQFTHMADAMARIVLQNGLFLGRARVSALTVPWCTYTDPELAHVGLLEHQARELGLRVTTIEQPFERTDRAILDGKTEGFIRVVLNGQSDRILGATIVGEGAGDLISMVSLAMSSRLGLKAIGKTVMPYPTRSELLKRVADAYNRTRLTPTTQRWLSRWLRLTNS